MNEFPAAPLDRSTRMVTTGALILVFGTLGATATAADDPVGRVVPVGLGGLIVLLAWGYAPAGFRAGDGVLEVRRRLFGGRRYAVTGVRRPDWRVGVTSLRKVGSGGLFGWYGSFWRPGFGSFSAYVTDRSKAVLCDTDKGPVVCSPADPEGFVAALDEVRS